MKQIFKTILVATVLLLTTVLVGRLMLVGFDRNAKVQCQKLEEQSREYKDFFLSKYEKALCDDYGFAIVAPVR